MTDLIKAKIDLLSSRPGVYLMKNSKQEIIYVGKAKSLIKRVKQYFTRPQAGKVFKMVMETADFDTIEVASEKEALLLEINLIRKYYPKYNILLKDGKSYPFIALKKDGDPLLKIAYKDKTPGYKYFGPFPNSGAVYQTIDLLNKIYPLRKCQNIRKEPCLYYHLGQCLGPCVKKISEEEYQPLINEIQKFLSGDIVQMKSKYTKLMQEASNNLEFEKALEYKNIITSIEYIASKQGITMQDHLDRDVIAISTRESYFALAVMTYRNGMLLGKNIFIHEVFDSIVEQSISMIFQYYQNHNLPKELLVGDPIIKERLEAIYDIKIFCPTRGHKKDLLLVAIENAKNGLDEHFLTARLDDDNLLLLEELGHLLNIDVPLRIELFDNSHLQGSEPIGAMVTFINGVKAPSMYRKYNIQKSSGKDDLKSMKEVIYRRYKRLKEENKPFPNLIIVDGGLNQINVAIEALNELEVNIPIAGLAKDDKHHTSGLIYNQTLIPVDHRSKLFLMLIRMQDEVHRYAITFNRSKRSKNLTHSLFDDIKGIGKRRKELLLKAYPSLDALKKATVEELSQLIPSQVANQIVEILKK